MADDKQTKQIGFRVSAQLHQKLKDENKRTDVPIQKIIERAVEAYLRAKKRGA